MRFALKFAAIIKLSIIVILFSYILVSKKTWLIDRCERDEILLKNSSKTSKNNEKISNIYVRNSTIKNYTLLKCLSFITDITFYNARCQNKLLNL